MNNRRSCPLQRSKAPRSRRSPHQLWVDAWNSHQDASRLLFQATKLAFPPGVIVAWMKGPDHHLAEVVGHRPPSTLVLRYGSGRNAWTNAINVKEIVGST